MEEALREVSIDPEMFLSRDGLYDWWQEPMKAKGGEERLLPDEEAKMEQEVSPKLPSSGQILGSLVRSMGLNEPRLRSKTAPEILLRTPGPCR